MSTITWRNVDKLSSEDMGKSFLDAAQKSIGQSIGGFGDIVKSYQATADANQAQLKENATYDFMQRIMAAKTAGEFGASSPELMTDLAAQGAGIDRSKLLPFMDKRGAELQARDTATDVFNNTKRAQRELPATEELDLAVAQRDPTKIASILAANPGLASAARAVNQDRILTEGATKVALDTDVSRQNIAASILSGTNATSTAAAAALNANTNVKQLKLQEDEAKVKGFNSAAEQAAKYEGEARKVSAGTIDSPEGRKAIDAQMETMLGKRDPDDKLRETLRVYVNNALANPDNRGMPVADFLAAMGAAKTGRTFIGNVFNNEGTYGKNIESDLLKARSATGYLDSIEKREKLADSNMVKANQFKTMMQGYYPDLAEAANPTGGVPSSAAIPAVLNAPAPIESTKQPVQNKKELSELDKLGAALDDSRLTVQKLLRSAPGLAAGNSAREVFADKLEKAKQDAEDKKKAYEAAAVSPGAAFGYPVKKQK